MKKEKLHLAIITILNFLIWLLLTAGFLSLEVFIISSLAYVIYTVLIILFGDHVLAQILRTKNFNEAGDLYDILNYSCNNYQRKCLESPKKLKFYFFEYDKPIAFAFGASSVFVSSSILQLRHSQQSRICMQAAAETDSLRGLANLFVILGNPLIIVAFIFILIGKWLVYLQLQLLKIMLALMVVFFEWCIGMTTNIFFGRARGPSLSALWLLRFGSLFSSDKISDAIYLVVCSFLSSVLYILSFGQIAVVRQFDHSTDRLLSKMWIRTELEEFLNTDYAEQSPEQPNLIPDRLKLLCRIVESHLDSQKRIESLDEYYYVEPQHRIRIRQQNDSRQSTRIRIHRNENGGHHDEN